MRILRLLCLLLCLCLLLPTLVACGGGTSESKPESSESSSESESASESESGGKWDGVNFEGEELLINVSVALNDQQTFGAADVYSRGPDSLVGADEVGKMIYDRNLNLASTLGLSVLWDETNAPVGEVQAVIETFVKTSVDNSPDLFINDVYDTVHAMLTGCLWNVYDTVDGDGAAVKSYFDFSHETWFEEYMAGTSLSSEKRYVLVSDYFIDVIRYSYVVYVNRDMFDEAMQGQYLTVNDLYQYVLVGEWDFSLFGEFIETVFRDTVNTGSTDVEDERKGLATSAFLQFALTFGNGLSVLEWDGDPYDSNPYVIENHPDYTTFATAFSQLYNTPGILYTNYDAHRALTLFLDGSYLFSISMMGEMESETVRDAGVNKGVLPLPKFSLDVQTDYHTLVHDQAEIASILNNARHFSAATAYLQKASEDSVEIMKEYYDKSLKLKYNEDRDTQEMLDLIHDRIVSPFELIITRLVVSGGSYLPGAPYQGQELYDMVFVDARDKKTQFTSNWTAAYDGWCQNLAHLLGLFENLD